MIDPSLRRGHQKKAKEIQVTLVLRGILKQLHVKRYNFSNCSRSQQKSGTSRRSELRLIECRRANISPVLRSTSLGPIFILRPIFMSCKEIQKSITYQKPNVFCDYSYLKLKKQAMRIVGPRQVLMRHKKFTTLKVHGSKTAGISVLKTYALSFLPTLCSH